MPLDDATKARLKAAADAKKGRTNLKGLDRTLGLVALDKVQDGDGERAEWSLRANGNLLIGDVLSYFEIGTRYYENCRGGNRYRLQCPWVRLSYAPEWLKEELAARWPSRKIVYHIRGVATTAPVFPVAIVGELFKFLWPEEWQDKATKYWTGYSEAYVQKWPGVGALLRVTHYSGNPVDWVGRKIESSGYLTSPWFSIVEEPPQGATEQIILGNASDRWEVIG